MARRQQASLEELDEQTIGIIVIADLAQIEADAEAHPDPAARRRILTATDRLRAIAQGEIDPKVLTAVQAALYN